MSTPQRRTARRRAVALALALAVGVISALAQPATADPDPSSSRASSRPADPAPRGPGRVTVSAVVPTRAAATIRGRRVSARAARPTVLQQRRGSTPWRAVARAASGRTGRVHYRVPAPTVTTRYRIRAPRHVVRLSRRVDGRRIVRRVVLPRWTGAVTRLQPGARRTPWVTGYYAGWFHDWLYPPEQVDMTAMTHFVFGRVAPGGGSLGGRPGQVRLGAGTAQEAGSAPDGSARSIEDYLVSRAHAVGTRAVLMLGGVGDGPGFVRSSDDATRARFVDALLDYLVEHDYDGLDLDWEDCLGGEPGCGASATESRRRVSALISDLRREAATRPRYRNTALLITFPGYVLNLNTDLEHGRAPAWRAAIAKAVDQYNLMSYGVGTTFNSGGWDSWFSGALEGASGSHPADIASSVRAYVAAGVPASRIGVGIGFFGVYWGPDITGPRQPTDDNEIFESDDVALAYSELDRMGYLDHGTRRWDREASSTYRTYVDASHPHGYVPPVDHGPDGEALPPRAPAGYLSYEDDASIAAKAAWVRAHGLGGSIVWTLNYGWLPASRTNPLLDAVAHSFLGRPS